MSSSLVRAVNYQSMENMEPDNTGVNKKPFKLSLASFLPGGEWEEDLVPDFFDKKGSKN